MAPPAEDFTGTKAVDDRLSFDQAGLEKWLTSNVPHYAGPLKVEQFKGGQSNPTYKLVTPGASYVLRRKPPGKLLPSAHAVDREYKVISALNNSIPVPKTFAYCDDESVVGTAFYVMEFLDGRIIWDPLLPGLDVAQRRAIYKSLNQTMAQLHTTDYQAVGLGDFGRPSAYTARQFKRWHGQYRASETESLSDMESLMEWLAGRLPDSGHCSVIHGDFRLDNCVTHASEPHIIGVLDWELSTLGDPIADFTYHLMSWSINDVMTDEAQLRRLGIPTIAEYSDMYREHSGFDMPEDQLGTYLAFNLFKLAAISQGIAGRVRDGTAASAHAGSRGDMARRLSRLGWETAQAVGT